MPKARVNDVRIFYQEAGPADGEPLVLIMGWGGDHTAWASQLPAFAERHRVIALDNRGAGQSDQPDVPYSIPGMAEDTLGLLDALGIARAHICGASMGGMIAQEIALGHPERVVTLQLHCTLARPDAYGTLLVESLLRVRARENREEWARALVPWLVCRKTVAERPDLVQALIQRTVDNPYPASLTGLRRQAEAIDKHDTLDRLGGVRAPTLVTVGAEDILVPPRFSREIHARVPRAELVPIPDAGHVHFIEQPVAFNNIALRFLAAHRAASP
jgi:pimeloyl-ACP methyl ester carboxylesterase